jgi:hypothetical protein
MFPLWGCQVKRRSYSTELVHYSMYNSWFSPAPDQTCHYSCLLVVIYLDLWKIAESLVPTVSFLACSFPKSFFIPLTPQPRAEFPTSSLLAWPAGFHLSKMAHFLRGKQAGVQKDLSSGLSPDLFVLDDVRHLQGNLLRKAAPSSEAALTGP